MYLVFTFLLIYFVIRVNGNEIEILGSGLKTIQKNDMLMVFYITVQLHGLGQQRVMLTMIECCEMISDVETDCETIDLYGSHIVLLESGFKTNLSLFYPTMYTYNRKGSCLFSVWYKVGSSPTGTEIRHRIQFDTNLHPQMGHKSVLRGFSSKIRCENADLDPFDNCNPVDCQSKYGGYRNFFNKKWKRCQKVPVCMADPNKELPDVVYQPVNNVCRNIERSVNEEDVTEILQGVGGGAPLEEKMVNIRCHHGEIDPITGLCICDYGWKSEPFDPDLYSPNSVYSMCNIKCSHEPEPKSKLIYHVIGWVFALWLASCIFFIEKYGLYCIVLKKKRARSRADALPGVPQGESGIGSNASCMGEYKVSIQSVLSNVTCHVCLMRHGSRKAGTDTSKSLWDIMR